MRCTVYVPPTLPPKKPIVLTDERVKAIFAAHPRILMNDGAVAVEGVIIGWQRTDIGTLGAIVCNPITNKRVLYGIDFKTGRPRPLGLPRPPKH